MRKWRKCFKGDMPQLFEPFKLDLKTICSIYCMEMDNAVAELDPAISAYLLANGVKLSKTTDEISLRTKELLNMFFKSAGEVRDSAIESLTTAFKPMYDSAAQITGTFGDHRESLPILT